MPINSNQKVMKIEMIEGEPKWRKIQEKNSFKNRKKLIGKIGKKWGK